MFGMVAGGFVLGTLMSYMPGAKLYVYNSVIEKCEATLPRNMHCAVTAVPVIEKENVKN